MCDRIIAWDADQNSVPFSVHGSHEGALSVSPAHSGSGYADAQTIALRGGTAAIVWRVGGHDHGHVSSKAAQDLAGEGSPAGRIFVSGVREVRTENTGDSRAPHQTC